MLSKVEYLVMFFFFSFLCLICSHHAWTYHLLKCGPVELELCCIFQYDHLLNLFVHQKLKTELLVHSSTDSKQYLFPLGAWVVYSPIVWIFKISVLSKTDLLLSGGSRGCSEGAYDLSGPLSKNIHSDVGFAKFTSLICF